MRFASSELLKIETALVPKTKRQGADRINALAFGLRCKQPAYALRRAAFAAARLRLVEVNGIEPMTSCLQSRRSPN
jgi:hypothetical protein